MRTLGLLPGRSPPGTHQPTARAIRAQSKQREIPASSRNDSNDSRHAGNHRGAA